MATYRVFQYAILDNEAVAFEYGYPVEAQSEEETVELIVEDREIINDDFLDCPPNGLEWLGNGYATPMHLFKEVV